MESEGRQKSCASTLCLYAAALNFLFVLMVTFGVGMSSGPINGTNEPFMFFEMPGSMLLPGLMLVLPGTILYGVGVVLSGAKWWTGPISSLIYFAFVFGIFY